jgi:lipopolysaccharide export system protein LptC
MSVAPLPVPPVPRLPRQNRTIGDRAFSRALPTTVQMARRRLIVRLSKWLLPAAALLLLASIALWPQFERTLDAERVTLKQLASAEVDGATLTGAHYRGIDDKGRPYTLTADTATQNGPERIDLVEPKGDSQSQSGAWMMVQSHDCVFIQRRNQLDLSSDVVIYRDDGTTLRTQSATVDFKAGAAAGAEPTHAEGPFGTLDAEGFAVVDKGAVIQFPGPGTLVMNAASSPAAPAPKAAP